MDWCKQFSTSTNGAHQGTLEIVPKLEETFDGFTNENLHPSNINNASLISSGIGTMCSPTLKDMERYNGLSEEDLKDKILPDHLKEGLDIVIVGINPSLASAHVGHHYAGPGNHFWTCLSQAGLVPMPVNCYNDSKMPDYGIGFTNVCTRPTKGAAELSRKEMKAGAAIMLEKMRKYKPKIAVFNGKGIYEAYVGHKNFSMGKQPQTLEGTDTVVFVMPSSSARCAQLPRAEDKLPFFVALRKLREYIRGELAELDDSEIIFADYTEFRVTQPDPKSLRKAERRRKRKAEAAAEAAAAAAANAGVAVDGSSAATSGQAVIVDPSTGAALTAANGCVVDSKNKSKLSRSTKRKGSADVSSELNAVRQNSAQILPNVSLTAEAHLQQQQQQQQLQQQLQQHQQAILLQQQQQLQQQFAQPVSQHSNFGQQTQQMIVSGGQLMSATPMVTLSMANGTAIPIQHGPQAAITGCYGTPQFQFSATPGGVPQPFFISPHHTGATSAGGQTLFQWPTAQTNATTLQFQQQTQQAQPSASWQGVSVTGVTLYNPQQAQQQQHVSAAVQSPAGGAASSSAAQQQQAQQLLVAQQLAGLQGTHQQHQQLLLSSHHPVGFPPTGASTATYPQQIYFAQAPAGASTAGGASYQLLPVGCPSNFTNLLLSEQQQQQQQQQQTQQQLTQCSTGQFQQSQQHPQQQQQPNSALQMQTAQQIQQQLQQQQLQVQQQLQQAHAAQQAAYMQPPQNSAASMLATEAAPGPTGVNASGTPATQFITLAPGAPLKVMTVGPNGQLIQATGLPQFMPAANPVGMAMQPAVAQQHTSIAIQPPRGATNSQPQQQLTNGRPIQTFFTPGSSVSAAPTVPLVHAASGGDDFISNPNGAATALGVGGDEKLVYTAL